MILLRLDLNTGVVSKPRASGDDPDDGLPAESAQG